MPNYPKEQLWELYKDLPKDLQKATFSEEVAANIQKVCKENGITDDDVIFDITKNIGYVFLGLLAPNEFSSVLEKELKIEKKKAEQISSEITRFVFLPVKKSLEALYQIKIKAEAKEPAVAKAIAGPVRDEASNGAGEDNLKRKNGYREIIE